MDLVVDLSAVLIVLGAGFGGNGEALGNRQAEVGHLSQVCALAAQQLTHVCVAFAEKVAILLAHFYYLQLQIHTPPVRKQAGDCTKKGRRDTPFLCVIIIIANYRRFFQSSGKIFEKVFEPVLGSLYLKLPVARAKSERYPTSPYNLLKFTGRSQLFPHPLHIHIVCYIHPAGMRMVPPAG